MTNLSVLLFEKYQMHGLLEECGMELMALPYVPNFAEYLALTNSGRILGDQMDFLKKSFSSNSRLRSSAGLLQ